MSRPADPSLHLRLLKEEESVLSQPSSEKQSKNIMDLSMDKSQEPLEILELMDDFKKKVRKHHHIQYLDAGGRVQNIRLTSGLKKRARGKWYNCQNLITEEEYSIDLKPKDKIWIAHDPNDRPANLPNLEDYYGKHHLTPEELDSVVDVSHVSMANTDSSSEEDSDDETSEEEDDEEEMPSFSDFGVSLDRFKEGFRTQGFITRRTVTELFTSAETLLDKAISFVTKVGRGKYRTASTWTEELTRDKEKICKVFDEVLETLNELRKKEQENLTNLDQVVLQVVEAKEYVTRGVDERIKRINLMIGDNLKDKDDMELTNIIRESTAKPLPPSPEDDILIESLSQTSSSLEYLSAKFKFAALLRDQAKINKAGKDAETQNMLIEEVQKIHKDEIKVIEAKLRQELEEFFENKTQKEKDSMETENRELEENLKQQNREEIHLLKRQHEAQIDYRMRQAQQEKEELIKKHEEDLNLIRQEHENFVANLQIQQQQELRENLRQVSEKDMKTLEEEMKKDFKHREEKLISDQEKYKINLREEMERRYEDYKAAFCATLANTSVTQQEIEIQNQKKKIQKCEKMIDNLEEQAKRISDQRNEAEKRARKLETDFHKSRKPRDQSVEKLEGELKSVQLSLRFKTRELDNIVHELAANRASKESMSQSCRQTERAMTKVREDLDQAIHAEELAQDQVATLRKELKIASDENYSLLLAFKENENESSQLKSTIKELRKKMKTKEASSSQEDEDHPSLQRNLPTKENESSKESREETERDQNNSSVQVNKSIMEGNSDDDFTPEDLLNVQHLCKSREDDPIALLLLEVKEQIDEDLRISQLMYNLNSIQNKELIELYKICHEKGEESLRGTRKKLLAAVEKKFSTVSSRLRPLLLFGWNTLMAYNKELFSAHRTVANEAKSRNVNVDKPNSQKEKYLSPPEFSGKISAESYHIYEYWKHLQDYINSIDMDNETAGAMIKGTFSGEAKEAVDRKFGVKIVPQTSKLKSFLEKEFGEEQTILDKIIKAHEALGKIEKTSEKAFKHVDLYNKAIFLETRCPKIVYNSRNYKNCLRTQVFDRKYMETIKIPLEATNEEEIKQLRKEIDIRIKHLKEDEKENRQSERGETSSYQTNSVTSVRSDTERKCQLCQHLLPFIGYPADDLHKFSKFNNVEPDSCGHLRSRTLAEKDDLLRTYKFCRNCLVHKLSSHHTEDTCRPRNDWFVCDHSDCDIHQAVCVKHQDLNMKELEKRQKTIGLSQKI